MLIYADHPKVRSLQILRDLMVLAWCAFWIWFARQIFQLIDKLGGLGRTLQDTSQRVDGNVDGLPSVVRSIGGPLRSIGEGLGSAGDTQVAVAYDLALFVSLFVALSAILPVLVAYAIRRVLWMRRVSAVKALSHSPHFAKLIAKRALLNQPLYKLAAISKDPMADVANGDFDELVKLELRDVGLLPTKKH